MSTETSWETRLFALKEIEKIAFARPNETFWNVNVNNKLAALDYILKMLKNMKIKENDDGEECNGLDEKEIRKKTDEARKELKYISQSANLGVRENERFRALKIIDNNLRSKKKRKKDGEIKGQMLIKTAEQKTGDEI